MMSIRSVWTWLFALSTSFYIWTMPNLSMVFIPETSHDDAIFIRIAANILYDYRSFDYSNINLAKVLLYLIWKSMNFIIDLHILVSQAMLYAVLLSLGHLQIEPRLAAASVAGIIVVTRFGLLDYPDATAIPGQNLLYLSPAYLVLLMFATLSTVAFVNQYRGTARRSPTADTDSRILNDASRNFA